jgi:hypothetical protein
VRRLQVFQPVRIRSATICGVSISSDTLKDFSGGLALGGQPSVLVVSPALGSEDGQGPWSRLAQGEARPAQLTRPRARRQRGAYQARRISACGPDYRRGCTCPFKRARRNRSPRRWAGASITLDALSTAVGQLRAVRLSARREHRAADGRAARTFQTIAEAGFPPARVFNFGFGMLASGRNNSRAKSSRA